MKPRHQALTRILILASVYPLAGCLDTGSSEDASGFYGDTSGPQNPYSDGSPTISGNPPPAITVGEYFSFTPRAEDPDGDPLTFSIRNKPDWAAFDADTGRISGLPDLGDVGNYSNISISVSDGENTATLSDIAVEVTQVATASTTLFVRAPLQNEDGSALTDLAGFKIYFGKSPRNYTNQISIDNPSVSTYVVENLSPGTYYFAATAFNAAGVESRKSNEVVRTLN